MAKDIPKIYSDEDKKFLKDAFISLISSYNIVRDRNNSSLIMDIALDESQIMLLKYKRALEVNKINDINASLSINENTDKL